MSDCSLGVSRPPLGIRDLPEPEQVFGVPRLGPWQVVKFAVGPSMIALGISIGSGEWLLGPQAVFAFIAGGWAASALVSGLNWYVMGHYRDKGYGMGHHTGFISGLRGGGGGLRDVGVTFPDDDVNRGRWRRWYRFAAAGHVGRVLPDVPQQPPATAGPSPAVALPAAGGERAVLRLLLRQLRRESGRRPTGHVPTGAWAQYSVTSVMQFAASGAAGLGCSVTTQAWLSPRSISSVIVPSRRICASSAAGVFGSVRMPW
ncbi:hypothetical protein J2S42_007367 [Catenuloplanes indicus]|uniref:Uncharacterized protein n=1 Tax=Catenuloplanes indicus TaxID=137267 RepID=A0AAE4B3X8_9ACTN|nr:hypothetical protein [Catenuloplanes indicus]